MPLNCSPKPGKRAPSWTWKNSSLSRWSMKSLAKIRQQMDGQNFGSPLFRRRVEEAKSIKEELGDGHQESCFCNALPHLWKCKKKTQLPLPQNQHQPNPALYAWYFHSISTTCQQFNSSHRGSINRINRIHCPAPRSSGSTATGASATSATKPLASGSAEGNAAKAWPPRWIFAKPQKKRKNDFRSSNSKRRSGKKSKPNELWRIMELFYVFFVELMSFESFIVMRSIWGVACELQNNPTTNSIKFHQPCFQTKCLQLSVVVMVEPGPCRRCEDVSSFMFFFPSLPLHTHDQIVKLLNRCWQLHICLPVWNMVFLEPVPNIFLNPTCSLDLQLFNHIQWSRIFASFLEPTYRIVSLKALDPYQSRNCPAETAGSWHYDNRFRRVVSHLWPPEAIGGPGPQLPC